MRRSISIARLKASSKTTIIYYPNQPWMLPQPIAGDCNFGLSIPTMGGSHLGYEIAKQFDMKEWPVSTGLVPLMLDAYDKSRSEPLSGVSSPYHVTCSHMSFEEDMLFTHLGLSAPAMLQISSYWTLGNLIHLSLQPDKLIETNLQTMKKKRPKLSLINALHELFPKKLLDVFLTNIDTTITLANCSQSIIKKVAKTLQAIQITPDNTESYRTAKVTLGGVDTNVLSSQTMEAKDIPGLFFIGECCGSTGWLGRYNFQWAWASGVAAGKHA